MTPKDDPDQDSATAEELPSSLKQRRFAPMRNGILYSAAIHIARSWFALPHNVATLNGPP